MEDIPDLVQFITRAHFEEAFSSARRSVTEEDLLRFDAFRTRADPGYAK